MFSLREDDLVTLLVGSDEHKFVVHESCLTRSSEFFKAAMKKEWVEGQTRTIKLPEEDHPEAFAHYLNFAYHKKLPTESIEIRSNEGFSGGTYSELGRIYVIGERMLDKAVQNAIAREFIRLANLRSSNNKGEIPGPSCIDIIYKGTTSGSPMRHMMADFYVTQGLSTWPYHVHHHEFLGDLAQQLQTKIIGQTTVRDFRLRNLIAGDYFV